MSAPQAHRREQKGNRARMDEPVVTPVAPTDEVQDVRLWAAPSIVVVTQALAGCVFLGMALVNLLGDHPSGWQRFIGVIAALVAGMAFGVAGSVRVQGTMVRRHLAACRAGAVPVDPPA
jgi:hypothetical protein